MIFRAALRIVSQRLEIILGDRLIVQLELDVESKNWYVWKVYDWQDDKNTLYKVSLLAFYYKVMLPSGPMVSSVTTEHVFRSHYFH